ncbi:MAG: glycosyltransferase family 4 protein [Planctomycetes bacterium]|nr:glycosyltransferase family 4 protein [Planctomycetota bacterium]
MRIGVDGRGFHSRRTGMEEAAFRLYGALAEGCPGVDFVAWTRGADSVPPAVAPNLRVRRIAGGGLLGALLYFHRRLARAAREDRVDLVHGPYHALPAVGCRSVITVHDLGFVLHPEWRPRRGDVYLRRLFEASLLRVDGVVAVSESTRRELLGCYPRLDPARVRVVHEAPGPGFRPLDPGGPEVQGVRARYGIRGDYLLFVGTVEARKNLGTLLGAFARLARRWPGLALVVAGARGWRSEAVYREARSLGGSVILTGRVPEVELPALYAGAACLALPSHHEGFGLPVLEAMACGTPVVCSRAGALPEVAGEAALLVDPLDEDDLAAALGTVLQDTELAVRLRRAGPSRAGEFSWARSAQATMAFFRELVEG